MGELITASASCILSASQLGGLSTLTGSSLPRNGGLNRSLSLLVKYSLNSRSSIDLVPNRCCRSTCFPAPTTSRSREVGNGSNCSLQWQVCKRGRGHISNAAKTSESTSTAENVAVSLAKSSVVPGEVLLAAEGLSKTFDGDRYLFQDLNLTIA
jgi:hypothetical protein